MAEFEPTLHKVKKGEDLTGIAKKYKHKNWKTIWEATENKGIVRDRKSPEKIQHGDVLFIPRNESQQKELEAERDEELFLQEALTEERCRLNDEIKLIDEAIQTQDRNVQEMVKSIESRIAEMNSVATTVDLLNFLGKMAKGVVELGKLSYKASKAVGAELKKLNDKALAKVMKLKKKQLKKPALKAAATLEDHDSEAVAILGIIADSVVKTTSLSYWTHTGYQIVKNGKNPIEAMRTEIGDDIKTKTRELTDSIEEQNNKLRAEKAAMLKRLRDINGLIGESHQRVKDLSPVR